MAFCAHPLHWKILVQKKTTQIGKYYDMKKILVWLVASLLLTMVGCVEGLQEPDVTETSSEQLPDLTAGFAEGKTKTYVESGKYLRWHEDDRLTAFYGNTLNRQYKFNGATGDNSGSFSYVPSGNLETGNALDRIYAVYPYDETATITDDGQISLTLPAVQTYAENSFSRGANTMLAVTENVEDTFLGFKNVCGYLKLKLYNAEGATIKSIEVKGNGDEKIAGAATATIAFGEVPQLTMADEATTTITIDCGDGVALGTTAEAATEFWVVIPETTFEGGITITVADTEGGTFEKSTTKEVVIERNAVQPMAALGVEFVAPVAKPANNEIWYTNGSTTEATTPNRTDVFGANIVSNTYDAEKECWVIKFDGEVTEIGDGAFYKCSSLESIVIPEIVTSIGGSAFRECSSLRSITIPNSVTTIGNYAFRSCGVKSITIPDSVTTIGNYAFQYCSGELIINNKIIEINYSDDNYPSNTWLKYAAFTSIIVGDSVTSIGEYAFCNCQNLTSVTIGDSVTKIGTTAFQSCDSLQEFKGKFASTDHRSLIIDGIINFLAPAGLTEYTIPDSVTSIKRGVFQSCSSLTSITVPDSVTEIEESAFRGCEKLKNVIIGNGVTTIHNYTFYDCDWLTSVTIGNSVKEIGSYAFSSCNSLASVTIGNSVKEIEDHAFSSCSSLTSITIPDGVTTIGYSAFYECKRLESVYCKPTTPPSLGSGAFNNNASGRVIYVPAESVSVYTKATYWRNYSYYIVGYDFEDDKIATPANNTIWYTATKKVDPYVSDSFDANVVSNEWDSATGKGVIIFDGEVTKIKWRAFYTEDLISVNLPNSVTMIGDFAFADCPNLINVTFPNSLTTIGGWIFRGCDSITSITIPDSVTKIEQGAFSQCKGLRSFEGKFASEDKRCLIIDGALIAFAPAGLTKYTIPNNVTSIGRQAFAAFTNLKSVTIPDGVTKIESEAFYFCNNLTSIYCKATTPPALGLHVFQYEVSYEDYKNIGCDIYVPATSASAYKTATDWSEYADDIASYDFNPARPENNEILYTNGSTTEATAPAKADVFGAKIVSNTYDADKQCWVIKFDEEVTTIGASAFRWCTSLTSVTIPDSVTKIEYSAFEECHSLTSVTIGDSVTSIGQYAFYACWALKSVTIPDSVTTIGRDAFCCCSSLTSVTIGNSVTSIGDEAFKECSRLTSVYCKATTPPSLGGFVFGYWDDDGETYYDGPNCPIYVPMGSEWVYTASNWSDYYIVGYYFL